MIRHVVFFAVCALASMSPNGAFARPCDVPVDRVIDGDTIVVRAWTFISPTVSIPYKLRVRFLRVDTPERGEEGYDTARDLVVAALLNNPVAIHGEKFDSFGRLLAEVSTCLPDGERVNINDALRKRGWKWQGK